MVERDQAGSQGPGRVFSARSGRRGGWPIARLAAKSSLESVRDRRRPVGAKVAEERAGRPRSQGFWGWFPGEIFRSKHECHLKS